MLKIYNQSRQKCFININYYLYKNNNLKIKINIKMLEKVVKIDKKEYVVSLNEYKNKPHIEYNNLEILENLGNHERIVSLINELSKILEKDQKKNLIYYGISHGGYIPINTSKYYDSIYIDEYNDHHLENLKSNIKYHDIKNILINEKSIEYYSCIVFLEKHFDYKMNEKYNELSECIIVVNNFHKITNCNFINHNLYKLSKSEFTIMIPNTKEEKFLENFHYFIKEKEGSNELDYDNLIHLTMIVKNSGENFQKVLTKNLDIIDRWTIIDTGSTDNTVDVIKKVLIGKKGELFEEPFIDFGTSRNRCLEFAGNVCKYKIILDDTYIIEDNLREFLEETRGDQFSDSFSLYITSDDVQYCSNRIIKTSSNLKYIYKIHEVIQLENNNNVCIPINKSRIFDLRSEFMEKRTIDRKEYDLKLLFEMVEEFPNEPRHLYYIGQTYNLLKKYELSFEYFMKRVNHPIEGLLQEKLDACFEAARLANFSLNKPWEECEKLYMKSFEMDKTRPESIYFIGIHYHLNNNKFLSYEYMKKAYEIGYPLHCQYSMKPTISFHYVPKFLSELCYQFGDYETGEKCCKTFLDSKILKNEYLKEMQSWYNIFIILNKYNVKHMLMPKKPKKPYFCFFSDGGLYQWSGNSILNEGIGGSETYIIEMSRYIQKSGKYNVIVFCNCKNNEIFENVEYRFVTEFFDFVRENEIEHCIISRYSECLPFSLKSNINNVYFTAHDLEPSGVILPLDSKFKKIFCLTEWHVDYFNNIFPNLKDMTIPFYYGIDKTLFDGKNFKKKLYKFIYSSYPDRGLLLLLKLWKRIINKYPSASLYIHSDIESKWANEYATEHMKLVKELFYDMIHQQKYNIYYMGWTSKEKLAQSWKTADVWLYPCIFKETFCLTSLEAAISKTLVVTNNLAGLQNTVNDRGLIISYTESFTNEWCEDTLSKLFEVLDNREKRDFYVNKNYEWAKNMTWENKATELINILKIN